MPPPQCPIFETSRTKSNVKSSLIQFDRFCISKYQRDSETILKDLKENPNVEKVYSILNAFVIWATQEHPEIITYRGRYKTVPFVFKALNPITVRRYLNNIRAYFEECGGFELSDRNTARHARCTFRQMISDVSAVIKY